MASARSGSKKKLTITACKVSKGQVNKTGDSYEVMLNPSEFTHNQGISYNAPAAGKGDQASPNKKQPQGVSAPNAEFTSYAADQITLNLVVDGTGVVAGKTKDVAAEIKDLQDIVYAYNSHAHQPNVVQVTWGGFTMNCRLTNMSTTYTVFKPDGDPLRAKVKLDFIQYISKEEESKRSRRRSPDLTRRVVVQAGDTLPLLCHQVYEDSSYYPEVAKANNLDGFRRLEPGTQLLFPPLS